MSGAKYVGRVVWMAVALGIWAAVMTLCQGVACAAPSDSSSAGSTTPPHATSSGRPAHSPHAVAATIAGPLRGVIDTRGVHTRSAMGASPATAVRMTPPVVGDGRSVTRVGATGHTRQVVTTSLVASAPDALSLKGIGRPLINASAAGAGPIYQAIQQVNEKLLIGLTNLVGWFEQPLVPYLEGIFGPPIPPPVPLPAPINGEVSLILSGSAANVPPDYLLAQIAQQYNLPGGYGAVWQPSQFFPLTPHLGNLTLGQSTGQGVPYLDEAIRAEAGPGNNATNITVWTTSQSAIVATVEIRNLMDSGSPFQDQLKFILTGNLNNPDGGIFQRFAGFYVPGVDLYLNGATPANSPYPTTVYSNQYDLAANFPQYVLNPFADINSIFAYAFGVHFYTPTDLASAIQLPTSPGYHGQTTYYWIPTQNLPLVEPLRRLIIPPWDDAIADLLQPDLRVLVDLGYASGNYADIPTPAQLFELPNLFTIIPDLIKGAVQGLTAFAVDLGWLPPSMKPTTYPFVPTLDPNLNFRSGGQYSVTGVSLITEAEGLLMHSLALIPSWWNVA
jgi:hypothetical protein